VDGLRRGMNYKDGIINKLEITFSACFFYSCLPST
jgi:hypothetical protein